MNDLRDWLDRLTDAIHRWAARDREREALLYMYVAAHDAGDLEGIAAVLARAETDAELDRLLAGIDRALWEEACGGRGGP